MLTGASGFLGKVIFSFLSAQHAVSTLGRGAGATYQVDLAQEIPVFHEHFDTVVHASGKAHVIPQTAEEARAFFEVNVRGTQHLIDGLMQSGRLPRQFVFISTVAVYGREAGEGITEDEPLLGATPYAQSKLSAEALLTAWCAAQGIVLTLLRLPLIVGPHAPGNLGAMVRLMKRGLYVGIGSGEARKSVVLAEDVAHFIPVIQHTGGVYHLTDGVHPSMRELEDAIAAHLNKTTPTRLPHALLKLVARVGDLFGKSFPITTHRYHKLTAGLTFSDDRARQAGWKPRAVTTHLSDLL